MTSTSLLGLTSLEGLSLERKMKNKRARDSETGLFIPLDEAKRRPKETTVETIKKTPKPAPKR